MPNQINLRSRSVDGRQETKLILQDMNDEDIRRYIHEVLTLDIDCQYERFSRRDEQRHPRESVKALSLNPSSPRRSLRLSQQIAKRR